VQSALEASRPLLEAAGHTLSVTLPSRPLVVLGDEVRLAQVLANLLNNATKYTLEGGHIELSAEREEADVVLSVRDNGVGIPPEMLTHIFEMFAQVDSARERSQGGLGLGLTLVRRLVEMHGGSVRAQSEGAGKGATFSVRLPLAEGNEQWAMDSPEGLPPTHCPLPTARRILVVDDNVDVAESLGQVLKLMGNEVQLAHTGPTALALAQQFVPEVVLLDIGLPGMDGYEVARRLRQLPALRDVLLIAQTGWGQAEDSRRSLDAGFDHHLTKPIDLDVLRRLLAAPRPKALEKHV
jgi:CheY-like chemotaxis protein/anti-sigma regulatory factor (Ser/Thr protein kinase)